MTKNTKNSPEFTRRGILAAATALAATTGAAKSQENSSAPEAALYNADILITGAYIDTFSQENTIYQNGAIAISGNKIIWIGDAQEGDKKFKAKEVIIASGLIAMPGFTDTHYHTAQQFLRGPRAVSHKKGPSWKKNLIPFESILEPEDVYLSGMMGYMSMISSGTTCFLESGGPHPDEMGRAGNDVGIRGMIAVNTCDIDGPGGPLPKTHIRSTKQCLDDNAALVKRWSAHPRINAWLSLRQILVNSEELRVSMWSLANDLDTTIHTHLSEGTYEIDYTIDNYNLRPPAYFKKLGIFDKRMHCAHSVLLTDAEVKLYAENDVSVGHCAFHNYFLAPHKFYEMVSAGIRAGLGTDGPGARGTLDMFQVAHYAVMGQTLTYGAPVHAPGPISYQEMLKYAVWNGARAAKLDAKIGSLEIGKCADIVLCEGNDIDQSPCLDGTYTLAAMTTGRNVLTVIVDGKVVMKNRKFISIDENMIKEKAKERYRLIHKKFSNIIS
ncbi:amidohydrolase family protein [Acetobacter persici]|uniref:amidohydrolase family protein n=1 Tax=Acetobacter persici TaxID=1076596 RepID=UPI0039EAD1DA